MGQYIMKEIGPDTKFLSFTIRAEYPGPFEG